VRHFTTSPQIDFRYFSRLRQAQRRQLVSVHIFLNACSKLLTSRRLRLSKKGQQTHYYPLFSNRLLKSHAPNPVQPDHIQARFRHITATRSSLKLVPRCQHLLHKSGHEWRCPQTMLQKPQRGRRKGKQEQVKRRTERKSRSKNVRKRRKAEL
jgi:hypothetical protein